MPYSIQDQITELSKKLTLHEGDLKAYDEASKQEIQQNFEKITELRASNKTLHKKLADSVNGDCKVIENALGDRKVERQALRSKPGREAVEIIDQKVCDYIKKLNAMKAETERKRKKCEEAKIRKEMVAKDLNDQMANSKGESEQAKYLRSIENRLDKAILKQQEAEHVKALYEKMRDQLQAKALTFHNTLEAREIEIEEANRELKRVKEMLIDAQDARDAAKNQFNQNEEVLIKERRQRERELQELRLRAEEKRGVEIMERRATRTSLSRTGSTPPTAPSADQTITQVSSADMEAQLKHYETIYQKIKDATGVSSIAEAVNRFESQGETASHLQNLKAENENKLALLKEEKARLESQFNTLQYSDAESVAKIDAELKQAQSELDKMIKEKQESQDQLDKQNKLLLNVRSGVQHLADKLDFVDGKVDPDSVPDSPVPNSDQPDDIIKQISHILSRSGLRINNLMNSLGEDGLEGAKERAGNDLASWATTRVEEIQPYSTIRTTKANANTQRVPGDLSDSETSGEDDGQMLTRDAIKKQAQNIIDSKTKKRKIKKGKR